MNDSTRGHHDQPADEPDTITPGQRLGSALEHGNNSLNPFFAASIRAVCWLTGDGLGQAEDVCDGVRNPPSTPVPPKPYDPRNRR